MGRECESKTDNELVQSSLDEKDLFVCIVDRYEKKIERYIRRITNVSSEDVQDLLQDVFIKVYTNLNDFDTKLSFSSWIYRIAHNVVISNHRKKSVRPEGNAVDVDDEILLSIIDSTDIEQDIDRKYLRKYLFIAMDEISEKYREVLILRFMEEKDYGEISDILQKPMGSVATLINRAKKKLKEAFIRSGYSKHDYER